MLATLLLTTTLAAPVFISGAQARHEGGTFTLEIAGEESLAGLDVEPTLMGRILVLAIDKTRVREHNRAWGEGSTRIKAHRHDDYTEISVPLPSGATCAGPVSISRSDTGAVRASMACAGGTSAAVVTNPTPATKPTPVAKATPSTKVAPAELKSAVALPPEDVRPLQVAPKPEPLPVAPKVEPKPVGPPLPVAAAPKPLPDAASKAGVAPTTPWSGVILPLFALAAIAGVTVVLGKRRRAPGRLVQIVETASLGPKRSLIVARIGGETVVLGASEAGISVLKAGTPAAPIPTEAPVEPSAPVVVEEPVAGQAGVLARLFSGRPKRGEAELDDSFAQVLEDSVEDQELRRKLSSGVAVRVP